MLQTDVTHHSPITVIFCITLSQTVIVMWLSLRWCYIKCLYLPLRYTPTHMLQLMRQAYNENILSHETIFHWHQIFYKGCESSDTFWQSGQSAVVSSSMNKNAITTIMKEDHSITIRQITVPMGRSKMSVDNLLQTNLHMRHVSSCWVLHHLTFEQLQKLVDVCNKWWRR